MANKFLTAVGVSSTDRNGSASDAQDSLTGLSKPMDLTYESPWAPALHLPPNISMSRTGAPSVTPPPMTAASTPPGRQDDGPDADAIRGQANQMVQKGVDAWTQAMQGAAPQYQQHRYSPLESGLGLLLAGAMNNASPYTSEGTQAANAYMAGNARNSDIAYQNAVEAHKAEQARGQALYQMAQAQAAPYYQQAQGAEESDAAADRQRDQQEFQGGEAEKNRAFDNQQAYLRNQYADHAAITQHQNAMDEIAAQAANAIKLAHEQGNIQSEQDLHRAVIDHIMQNPQARGIMATDTLLHHGYSASDATRLGSLLSQQSPDEIRTVMQNDVLSENLKQLRMDTKNKPLMDALDQSFKRAQIGAMNAQAASAGANTAQTTKQTGLMGSFTPEQKLGWFNDNLRQSNASYIKALGNLADYKATWAKTHAYSIPGQPQADITQDPTYNALADAVDSAKTEADNYSKQGNDLLELRPATPPLPPGVKNFQPNVNQKSRPPLTGQIGGTTRTGSSYTFTPGK